MRLKPIAILGGLSFLLMGCAPVATSTSPTPSPTPAQVQRVPPATFTPPPTPTEPTPSSTPAPATPTPTRAPTPLPPVPPLALQLVADGFDEPVSITSANDGSNRLFVAERQGKVRVVQQRIVQPAPFLNITSLVGSQRQEQGLLSIVFHPDFPTDPRVFVDYTDKNGATVIASYRTTADFSRADPTTAAVLMTFPQPYRNHNGGQLQFGPDGYLYIGTGDGGAANDPHGNGQNLDTLLGKLLRVSVDFGTPYTIPADNPFAAMPKVRPEIWAYGLRNPWRFSFDRLTDDLWIADVGQNLFEEVNFMPAGTGAGTNYGWNVMEGLHCFQQNNCNAEGLVLPIAEYSRDQGCSITGGYVYRGDAIPTLQGVYLYGDYCSGKIWALRPNALPVEVLATNLNISSFGEDETGELYVADLNGGVYQITSVE